MATPTATPETQTEVKNQDFKTTDGTLTLNVASVNNGQIKILTDMAEFMDSAGLQNLYDGFLKRNAEVKPGRGRSAGPIVLNFTAKAAKVFELKVLDGKDNKDVASEAGIKVGNINITIADVALKVLRNAIKENVVSPDAVRGILNAHGTMAEKAPRKPRADKKQTDNGAAPSAEASAPAAETTPTSDSVQLSDAELAAIAASA